MIDAIIFDFGDVFINLDKQGTIERTKSLLGVDIISEHKNPLTASIYEINDRYEKGLISTYEFVSFYTTLTDAINEDEFIALWNSLLSDFPVHRLRFIQELATDYNFKLLLLSNTNELHINWIKAHIPFYDTFKECFDAFYLSHEIHLRKPDPDIFNFLLEQHQLHAEHCLFIDDTLQNIVTARSLGFHTWHLDETIEDVTELFSKYATILGHGD